MPPPAQPADPPADKPAGPDRRSLLLGAGVLLAGCRAAPGAASGAPATAPATPAGRAPATSPAAAAAGPTAASGARPVVVRRASTGRAEVALTFHGSGDPALAERLLAEAERAGAAVTVLAVGTWLRAQPRMAARILRGGHALGNHTDTHPTLRRLPAAGIAREVDRCAATLRRQTGTVGVAFRPSGGPQVTAPMVQAAAAAGYRVVLGYDVDSLDNTDPGADAVVARVLEQVRAGSVVSLHLGHVGTVQAMPRLLAGLARRGLRPVSVPVLLAPA